MSGDIKPQAPELFLAISEQEQENISGGCSNHSELAISNFFFQKTNIETFANSAINLSGSNGSISSVQQTGYKFSQIIFGFSMGVKGNKGSSSRRFSLLNMIFNMPFFS